jgi:CRISPR-associated endonuclease Csy4
MNFYLEITLLPNPEVNPNFLWSKVYQQLHLGLVELQDGQKKVPIGISFPEYKVGDKFSLLGGKCRLFAQDEATLTQFNAAKWLARLSDYVHCTSIRPVPDKLTGYASYQRVQPKTNKERLARRYAKRHELDFETALNDPVDLKSDSQPNATYKLQFRYCDMLPKAIPSPFIRLKSLSNEQTFCLCIKKTDAAQSSGNSFNSYGLSATTTVPEF